MYITISPNKTLGSRHFINYLEKEDKIAGDLIKENESLSKEFADYLDKENQINGTKSDMFFNHESYNIDKNEVVKMIDNNRKGLKEKESNFFSITLNPSEKEIRHMQNLAYKEAEILEKTGVGNLDECREYLMRDMLKQYSEKCMDEYAKNFGRETIKGKEDLVWFGKVEQDRYWKWKDPEVVHNRKVLSDIKKLENKGKIQEAELLRKDLILESQVRAGGKDIPVYELMPKNGDNYHVHIIVSRRDREQKMSLSPLAKARENANHQINGRTCKIGFNRDKFTQNIEKTFDNNFEYERQFHESYLGRKTRKLEPEKIQERKLQYNLERGIEDKGRDIADKKLHELYMNVGGFKVKGRGNPAQLMLKKASLGMIKHEYQPYKQFYLYGRSFNNIIKAKTDQTRDKAIQRMAGKAVLDISKAAGYGIVPVTPVAAAISGIKFIAEMAKGKSQGMEIGE